MVIKIYRAYTPGSRNKTVSDFSEITKTKPEKSLITKVHRSKGRNNKGIITVRHRGGGHKKRYRLVDFKRNKNYIVGKVISIEYDPNRSARIALISYQNGKKNYILHSEFLKIGDEICSGEDAPIKIGNEFEVELNDVDY